MTHLVFLDAREQPLHVKPDIENLFEALIQTKKRNTETVAMEYWNDEIRAIWQIIWRCSNPKRNSRVRYIYVVAPFDDMRILRYTTGRVLNLALSVSLALLALPIQFNFDTSSGQSPHEGH